MDNNQKDIHIRVPKEIYTRLKVDCAYRGVSIKYYLTELINLNKNGKSLHRNKVRPGV
jgi:predicted DNA-binding protein